MNVVTFHRGRRRDLTLRLPHGILSSAERGCSSVVERLLAKEKVVGSNPIARSH